LDGRFEKEINLLPLSKFELNIFQPVVWYATDYAITAAYGRKILKLKIK
jgi:hypothetical protein